MVVERVSLESASPHTLYLCAQAHRYEFATSIFQGRAVVDLGCGSGNGARTLRSLCSPALGVDENAAEVDLANAIVGRVADVEFVIDDLLGFLRSGMPDGFCALVAYELLDRVSEPEAALHELRRHAQDGVQILTSVTTGDDGTPVPIADAKEWFAGASDIRFFHQYETEGSLIETGGRSTELAEVTVHDRAEPDYAASVIVAINVGSKLMSDRASAMLPLRLQPLQRRYIRSLEVANGELRRTNARLGREHLGVADSAAASLLRRTTAAAANAVPDEGSQEKADLDAWVASLELEIERHRQLVRNMEATRAWRVASRYRGIRRRLGRLVPGR